MPHLVEKKHFRKKKKQKINVNMQHSSTKPQSLKEDKKINNEENDFMYFLTEKETEELSNRFNFENIDDKNIINEAKKAFEDSCQKEKSFFDTLIILIKDRYKKEHGKECTDERVLKKLLTDLFKRAQISKKTLSDIKHKTDHHPTKETIMALIIALRLTPDEATKLLSIANIALSPFKEVDTAFDYIINSGCLNNPDIDVIKINEFLHAWEYPLLGSKIREDTEATEKKERRKERKVKKNHTPKELL